MLACGRRLSRGVGTGIGVCEDRLWGARARHHAQGAIGRPAGSQRQVAGGIMHTPGHRQHRALDRIRHPRAWPDASRTRAVRSSPARSRASPTHSRSWPHRRSHTGSQPSKRPWDSWSMIHPRSRSSWQTTYHRRLRSRTWCRRYERSWQAQAPSADRHRPQLRTVCASTRPEKFSTRCDAHRSHSWIHHAWCASCSCAVETVLARATSNQRPWCRSHSA